eukprot:tig00000595_g2259.t1
MPDYGLAVIIPVALGGCLVALVVCLVAACTYMRRWRRLPDFTDVRISFEEIAPRLDASRVAVAVAKSLKAPRVAAVGVDVRVRPAAEGEPHSVIVRVHDVQHRSTGEVRHVKKELASWAANVSPGLTMTGCRVRSIETLGFRSNDIDKEVDLVVSI